MLIMRSKKKKLFTRKKNIKNSLLFSCYIAVSLLKVPFDARYSFSASKDIT